MLFSTKNSNQKKSIIIKILYYITIVNAICFIIILNIVLKNQYMFLNLAMRVCIKTAVFICSFSLILMTCVSIYKAYIYGTFIDVYENYIEGKALHGIFIHEVYLKNNDIVNLSISLNNRINIYTVGGVYTVITNTQIAHKLYYYYKNNFNTEYIK